jgi:hypothetical protein
VKSSVALIVSLVCALAPLGVHAEPDTNAAAPAEALAASGFETGETAESPPGPRPPVRVPRTEFDTAYRFNMDSSKKLTAAEFDAWLASMGARVVGADEGRIAGNGELVSPSGAVPRAIEAVQVAAIDAGATAVEVQPAAASAVPQAVNKVVE